MLQLHVALQPACSIPKVQKHTNRFKGCRRGLGSGGLVSQPSLSSAMSKWTTVAGKRGKPSPPFSFTAG